MTECNRRNFLKTSAIAASAALVASSGLAFAHESVAKPGIVYTKDEPGHWQGKEGTHAPQITVEGRKVSLVTPHPMTEEHFIVRHTLVLADGKVIGAKNFDRADKAESTYDLPADYSGTIYATSFCNLHDLWVTEAQV
jgi:superoxide reductase